MKPWLIIDEITGQPASWPAGALEGGRSSSAPDDRDLDAEQTEAQRRAWERARDAAAMRSVLPGAMLNWRAQASVDAQAGGDQPIRVDHEFGLHGLIGHAARRSKHAGSKRRGG